MKPQKLLFITGSRGEWGYIRPLLRLCDKREDIDYSLCVTNMHLAPIFGSTYKAIEADGFAIKHKLHMALDGYSHVTMAKSLGILLSSLADVIASDTPDWVVLAGDRGEQLMGAIVSAFCYIPIAHIQAGELSGNIDGMTRHAIGKYAHVHLASNEDACQRLRNLGEEEFRIHNVGAPQLDELIERRYSSVKQVRETLGFNASQKYILVIQHPVTEDLAFAEVQIRETLCALNRFPLPKVVILPNNDAGSLITRDGISKYRAGDYFVFSNVCREDFLCLLKEASCMVGNSSAGLLEAPSFGVPSVNLGRRQAGRVRAMNVIDEEFRSEKIYASVQKALSPDFRNLLSGKNNPYGDGHSAERIMKILLETKIDDHLLVKNLTY